MPLHGTLLFATRVNSGPHSVHLGSQDWLSMAVKLTIMTASNPAVGLGDSPGWDYCIAAGKVSLDPFPVVYQEEKVLAIFFLGLPLSSVAAVGSTLIRSSPACQAPESPVLIKVNLCRSPVSVLFTKTERWFEKAVGYKCYGSRGQCQYACIYLLSWDHGQYKCTIITLFSSSTGPVTHHGAALHGVHHRNGGRHAAAASRSRSMLGGIPAIIFVLLRVLQLRVSNAALASRSSFGARGLSNAQDATAAAAAAGILA